MNMDILKQPYFRLSINRFKDIHKLNYGYPIFMLLKDILNRIMDILKLCCILGYPQFI